MDKVIVNDRVGNRSFEIAEEFGTYTVMEWDDSGMTMAYCRTFQNYREAFEEYDRLVLLARDGKV